MLLDYISIEKNGNKFVSDLKIKYEIRNSQFSIRIYVVTSTTGKIELYRETRRVGEKKNYVLKIELFDFEFIIRIKRVMFELHSRSLVFGSVRDCVY